MIRRMMATAAVAGLFSSAAQAGVVYNWSTIDPGNVPAFTARLEVDNAAYLSGGLNEHYRSDGCPAAEGCTTQSTTQLVSFEFDRLSSGSPFDILIDFRVGAVFGGSRPAQDFTLQFLTDGSLAGRISVDNTETELITSGTGLWSFDLFGSGLAQCGGTSSGGEIEPGCTATGRWVLDASTAPVRVPEPGILPLLALGAFGVAASIRRRKGQ